MPKTIQIRDVDDDVYSALTRRAAEKGLSVPELLRQEATRLSRQLTMGEWLERTRQGPRTDITTKEVREALDEIRGPWPNVDS